MAALGFQQATKTSELTKRDPVIRIAFNQVAIGPAGKWKQYDTAAARLDGVGNGKGQRSGATDDGERALACRCAGPGHGPLGSASLAPAPPVFAGCISARLPPSC